MNKEDVIEILERFVIGAEPCSQRDIVDACAFAYGMLKKQPSLPANLDEAAAKYEEKAIEIALINSSPFEEELNGPAPTYSEAFIAGAEWMAGQGVTVKGLQYGGNLGISDIPEEFYTDKQEDVIVQIRKK